MIAACMWFVYGMRKHDNTIPACIGWVRLDAASVTGVIVHS